MSAGNPEISLTASQLRERLLSKWQSQGLAYPKRLEYMGSFADGSRYMVENGAGGLEFYLVTDLVGSYTAIGPSGRTDSTDQLRIQTLANSRPNRIYNLLGGDYNISSPILIRQHGAFLKGVGERNNFGDALILAPTPTPTRLIPTADFPQDQPLIQFGAPGIGGTYVGGGVFDMELQCNLIAGYGILNYNTHSLRVEDVIIRQHRQFAVTMTADVAGGISDCHISRCICNESGSSTFGGGLNYSSGCGQSWMTDNFVECNGYGILDNGAFDNRYIGNYVELCGADTLSGAPGYGFYCDKASGLIFNDNEIGGEGGTNAEGIFIRNNGAAHGSFMVNNNLVINPNLRADAAGAGINFGFDGSFYSQIGSISNNQILDTNNKMVYGVYGQNSGNPASSRYWVKGNLVSGGAVLLNDIQIAAGTTKGTVFFDGPSFYGIDNRTGLTAPDGAPITLATVRSAGTLVRVQIDIFATAFTSGTATYTLTWTENAVAKTLVVTATALNTLGTGIDLINPDTGTNITVQLTGVFVATVKVAAVVEQLDQ